MRKTLDKRQYSKYKMRMYLKKRRSELNLTSMDVATDCGLSQNYYQQLENGERGNKLSVVTLIKFSDALDINLCDLVLMERDYIEALNG